MSGVSTPTPSSEEAAPGGDGQGVNAETEKNDTTAARPDPEGQAVEASTENASEDKPAMGDAAVSDGQQAGSEKQEQVQQGEGIEPADSVNAEDIAPPVRRRALPDTLPGGAKPLFISGASQLLFKCKPGEDVSDKQPYALVPKQAILDDFSRRAAVCDFQPFKETILKYPADEVLLFYDADYKYGENFVACITEEAKQAMTELPYEGEVKGGDGVEGEEEEDEDEADGVPVAYTPVPRPWVNLGSDLEVIDEQCSNKRPLLSVKVWRKRRLFGAPVSFEDSDFGDKAVEQIASEVKSESTPIQILEQDKGVQAIPETKDSMDQTNWRKTVNTATQYQPREMDDSTQTPAAATTGTSTQAPGASADAVHEEKNQTLEEVVQSLLPNCEMALQQNEIMDIFYDDYQKLPLEEGGLSSKSESAMKEYQSFTDLRYSKDKTSTCVRWHPSIRGLVGVSYAQALSFDERIEQSSSICLNQSLILLWSYSDPIHPLLILEAPEDVMIFDFCPTHPGVIAAGCISGQIVLWDLSGYDEKLKNHMILGKDTKGSEGGSAKVDTVREREKGIFEGSMKTRQTEVIRFHAAAAIEDGHQSAINDLIWLPAVMEFNKAGSILKSKADMSVQLVTASSDGSINVWDIRPPPKKQNEMPKKEVPHPADAVLKSSKHGGRIPPTFKHLNLSWKPSLHVVYEKPDRTSFFSPYKLALRLPAKDSDRSYPKEIALGSLGGPGVGSSEQKVLDEALSKLFVGTECGQILYVSWGLVKDPDSGKLVAPNPEQIHNFHCGPIVSLERSPFFDDIILSVSSWTFAIWKEGLHAGAVLQSAPTNAYLTVGKWSPTRPGVFFIGKANGTVDVWDLLDKSHQPTLSQNISALGITALVPRVLKGRKRQVFLAIGDASGTLHVTELPWSLARCSGSERSAARAFFDREAERHRYMQSLVASNAKAKEAKQAADEAKANEAAETSKARKARQNQEYSDFIKFEHTLLVKLGIRQDATQAD